MKWFKKSCWEKAGLIGKERKGLKFSDNEDEMIRKLLWKQQIWDEESGHASWITTCEEKLMMLVLHSFADEWKIL